jgi:hypothetical protein
MAVGLAVSSLLACGGSKNVTVSNNAGSGTSTLSVMADVTGSQESGAPLTSFTVNVADSAGKPVSGATVQINASDLSTVTLVETPAGSGTYLNSTGSYPSGSFNLAVVRGSDKVQGVTAGNPGMATIHAPVANATVPANQPLVVTWSTPSEVPTAAIETSGYHVNVADIGTYTIPAGNNPAKADQHLNITRSNDVAIAGALPGSHLRVEFTSVVGSYVVQ